LITLLAVRAFGLGEIRILDSSGAVKRVIPFNEAERKLKDASLILP
jgi:hypothetical protein